MNTITITKSEYEELLAYKEMAELKTSLKTKTGRYQEHYQYLKDFYSYCKQRYRVMLREMENEYKKAKLQGAI